MSDFPKCILHLQHWVSILKTIKIVWVPYSDKNLVVGEFDDDIPELHFSWITHEYQSRSTHSLGFVFFLWCLNTHIKIMPFHLGILWIINFLYSKHGKSSSNIITATKIFCITAPFMKCVIWQWENDITVYTHYNVTMGSWLYLSNQNING